MGSHGANGGQVVGQPVVLSVPRDGQGVVVVETVEILGGFPQLANAPGERVSGFGEWSVPVYVPAAGEWRPERHEKGGEADEEPETCGKSLVVDSVRVALVCPHGRGQTGGGGWCTSEEQSRLSSTHASDVASSFDPPRGL
ncbi:hypothetical protein [Streptomyces sp. GESEQ-35]|uniref:hypothetical protein n=1 Tax=Streptomyces sp. GESEQ-35 TaxID=2812657 RepID=UPI001FF4F972|nr:hypothetical protein [Streptomyces sp. GESEQ-35]